MRPYLCAAAVLTGRAVGLSASFLLDFALGTAQILLFMAVTSLGVGAFLASFLVPGLTLLGLGRVLAKRPGRGVLRFARSGVLLAGGAVSLALAFRAASGVESLTPGSAADLARTVMALDGAVFLATLLGLWAVGLVAGLASFVGGTARRLDRAVSAQVEACRAGLAS